MNWTEECRRWAAKNTRLKLEVRSKGFCERCHKKFIQKPVIHHIYYQKTLESVLFVCKDCHTEIHRLQEEKSFLKKLILWLGLYYEKDTVKKLVKDSRERLEELKLDKDIPPDDEEVNLPVSLSKSI